VIDKYVDFIIGLKIKQVNMKIDLHVHSTYSDGLLDPHELLELAEQKSIDYLAITDHDTLDGYNRIFPDINDYSVKLIPGVEISSNYKGKDVHILAYNFDVNNSKFIDLLKTIQKGRQQRAKKILELLWEFGVIINYCDVEQLAGEKGLVGRPHIAQAMINGGYVRNKQEAFDKYIGDNGPAYYAKPAPSPKKIIKAVKSAGGLSVVAHPYIIGNDKIVFDLIKFGIQGIEVYYGKNNPDVTKYYESIACEFDLIRTGGSDFHGGVYDEELFGSVDIPDFVFDELEYGINTKQVLTHGTRIR
jgi:predicted metal-dependent phosphoesterase TrpH